MLTERGAGERGVALTGRGGFLPEMIKSVLERGMDAELTSHLGYERGDRVGHGSGNSRNGSSPKTIGTEVGDVGLDQPRDRNSSFASKVVPKGARRLGGLEDMIISLYAGGMTVRDIQHHLAATIGSELSAETISNVTEAVAEEVTAWQSRPLEAFYPVIYLDALVVKIRDGAHVANRAAHIAVGVDMDGIKHVLGIWIQSVEGAKFWAGVCAQLANRGVKDVLIVCCDGLTGFPEAIEATWSAGDRANLRGAPDPSLDAVRVPRRPQGRSRAAAPDLHRARRGRRPERAGHVRRLDDGPQVPRRGRLLGGRVGAVRPLPGLGPALRKVIYTTNSIESLNYQMRKIIKNRGHFPNDTAAIKLLWLAIMNIEDKRARERAKEAGTPKGEPRKAAGRLVEGGVTQGWKAALSELALIYPDRITPNL